MNIQQKTINTLRVLSAEMVQKANSGHPGAPMGMAAMAYAVWFKAMRHDPGAPQWTNRDRFVLSNGHASALLYSLLHLGGCGYRVGSGKIVSQNKQFVWLSSFSPG